MKQNFSKQRDIVGKVYERYQQERLLGKGGMGSVFSVFDTVLKRNIAMKKISPAIMNNSNSVRRFIKEAQVMASLQHPSVVSVHDIGIDENKQMFLLMEEVEGKTMKDYINNLHLASDDFEWADTEWGLRQLLMPFIAYVRPLLMFMKMRLSI